MDIKDRLSDSILVDIYYIYAENKSQVRKLLNKLEKLGFGGLDLNNLRKIKPYNCYYIARQVHTNDSYNGNKFVQYGYECNLKNNVSFEKNKIDYNKFLKI